MRWSKPCSICSSPVRAEIDTALEAGENLRDLEKRSAFSRSALSRHSRKCLARQRVAEHAGKRNQRGTRIIMRWPLEAGPPDLRGKMTLCVAYDERGRPIGNRGGPETVQPSELRPGDCVVLVTYEQAPVRNPMAVSREEDHLRDLPLVKAEERTPMTFTDKLKKLFKRVKATDEQPPADAMPDAQLTPVAQPPESLERIQKPCQHDWQVIPGGRRCFHCGKQEMEFQPVGASFAHLQARKSAYGRFGS